MTRDEASVGELFASVVISAVSDGHKSPEQGYLPGSLPSDMSPCQIYPLSSVCAIGFSSYVNYKDYTVWKCLPSEVTSSKCL